MRLEKKRVLKPLRNLVLFLVLLTLLAGVAYVLVDPETTHLMAIKVVSEDVSQDNALFRGIEADLGPRLAPFMSQSLFKIPLREILQEVTKDRRVQAARIRRVFPGQLEISITPHRPVLVYLSPGGELFPVASDGSLLPRSSLADIPDVPILRGEALYTEEALLQRQQAIVLLGDLPDRGLFSQLQLSEVHFDQENGFELILLSGLSVLVGHGKLGLKASQIEQVLKYLNEQEIGGRVIDARFSKKVVVKLRHQL